MKITIELDIDQGDDEIDNIVYAYLKELIADGSLTYSVGG